jgi:hypothetical protein
MTLIEGGFGRRRGEIEKYLDVVWGWSCCLLCVNKEKEIKDLNDIIGHHI